MRPVFVLPLTATPAEVLARLRAELAQDRCPIEGSILRASAELTTHARDVHFWSPHLTVTFPETDGRVVLHGRFSPHPGVWMLFMGIYGILGMGAMGALVYGVSQATLGWSPWALWGVPVFLALIAFVYGAVFIGQGLGAEEMHVLRSVVERCAEEARPARVPEDAQG